MTASACTHTGHWALPQLPAKLAYSTDALSTCELGGGGGLTRAGLVQDVPPEWLPHLSCVHAPRIIPALCSMLVLPRCLAA